MRVHVDGNRTTASPCDCRKTGQTETALERAGITKRHWNCTLDSFRPLYAGVNTSLEAAVIRARSFVDNYPFGTNGKGLIFVGGYGVGKTHLAIGILRELVLTRGCRGLFCDYRTLLKSIQDSYGRSDISERQILAPIFQADVLVIDELGAAKPTDWVWDTVQHILNTRYNDNRTTILTTNYRNEEEVPMDYWDHLPKDKRDPVKANYRDNLGDRITERMRSRIMEMCEEVPMLGKDYRTTEGRASFKQPFGKRSDAPDTNVSHMNLERSSNDSSTEPHEALSRDAVTNVTQEKQSLLSLKAWPNKLPESRTVPSLNGLIKIHTQDSLMKSWSQEDIDRAVAIKTAEYEARRGVAKDEMRFEPDDI